MRQRITDIPIDQYQALAAELGLKPFAANQIIQWLYQKRVSSFDLMTNLSKQARDILRERFDIDALEVADRLEADDGTRKYLCRAADGRRVECVLIPADDGRCTVCVSTQVGCRMGCAFCRTGGMGFARNLTQGEILSQLIIAMRDSARQVTNVVLMGMGEPLENYDAVAGAVRIICDADAMGMSKKRVTLSTAGLLPELERFSLEFDIKIAVSLNATTDELRDRIMPINKKYPIAKIMEFCREYSNRSRNRVTFEYVMLGGLNDTADDAARLVKLLKGVGAKINLIPFNPYDGCEFRAPEDAVIEWWSEYLYNSGIQTNIRKSRGQGIMAACGQLATAKTGKR